ncbi:hypothetical protein [Psychromarinibacter sp. S121]|uniref:hypothetical protein n=1 Tax=Psychromarinibacter sp. S121 TaxID=3415127 RepID=UPI003C7E3304
MSVEPGLILSDPLPVEAAEPVRAYVVPGRNRRLVVVLAGSAQGGFDPAFYGQAVSSGENHAMFVQDESRSWMNGPGVADEMVRLITEYRDANGIEEIVTLGHSMGGFAAMVLAQLMPVNTVIAFAPQFSLDPELVPDEGRWPDAQIGPDARFRDVGDLKAEGTRYFIFHGDNPWEAWHWLRFPWRREGFEHFILAGQAHNLVRVLAKRRMLGNVVAQAIGQKSRAVRLALEKSFLGRSLLVQRRAAYQAAHPGLVVTGGAPMVVPPIEGAA